MQNAEPILVAVWMLSFSYPYVFVVGGPFWNGFQIWDMVNSVKIRHILKDVKHFRRICLNSCFLTISEFNKPWIQDNNETYSVVVYDVLELLDTTIAEESLWKKTFDYSLGEDYKEQINVCLNKTSLLVSHSSKISILNFWKDVSS